MEPTLEDAMLALIQGRPISDRVVVASDEPPASPAAPAETGASGSLAARAREAYDRAVAAQRRGDWAAYGEALEELGQILDQMPVEGS